MSLHDNHGRESAEDYPNLTHCPCTGMNRALQQECAEAGCGYCKVFEDMTKKQEAREDKYFKDLEASKEDEFIYVDREACNLRYGKK